MDTGTYQRDGGRQSALGMTTRSRGPTLWSVPIAAFLILLAVGTTQDQAADDMAVFDGYERATLAAFASLMRQSEGTHPWRQPITLVFSPQASRRMRFHAKVLADEFAGRTGISIAVAPPERRPPHWHIDAGPVPASGVVAVYLVPDRATADALARSTDTGAFDDNTACMAITIIDEDEPDHAIIIIPLDQSLDERQECLTHELMHVMGFHGHLEQDNTILNPYQGNRWLFKLDRDLLTLLYDRDISPGMSPETATGVARLRVHLGLLDGPLSDP